MAAAEALSRLVAPPGVVPHEASTWGVPQGVAFALAVVFTFEALTHIVPAVFSPLTRDRIPARGKHHDVLDRTDLVYLAINRALSIPFTYHYLRTAWVAPFMRWCAPLAPRTPPWDSPLTAHRRRRGAGGCVRAGAPPAQRARWLASQPLPRRASQPRGAAPLRRIARARRAERPGVAGPWRS